MIKTFAKGFSILIVLATVGVLVMPVTVMAQASATGSILGKASDQTGAVMPGVQVTVTSPALQVPQLTTVTDAEGNYRFRDIPAPGVYKVVFELAGFQTVANEGINVPAAFAARVDAVMSIGNLTETIEVSGQSPVVDAVSIAQVASIQQERLALTPLSGGIMDLIEMVAGASKPGSYNVGDSLMANRQNVRTYGAPLTPNYSYEGISIIQGTGTSTGMFLDSYQVQEASFKTTGNNADVPFPGLAQQLIMKAGGNEFHGSITGSYETPKLQDNNITPELAAMGFTVTNPIKQYRDWNADVGGYLIKNRVWWYGGLSDQKMVQQQIGFIAGPNAQGCWTCADAPTADNTRILKQRYAKFQFQATDATKFIGSYIFAEKITPLFGGSATTPAPTTMIQSQPTTTWKAGVQSTPTPHIFIDALVGQAFYDALYDPQPGMAVAGFPASQEITTQIATGPPAYIRGTQFDRWQTSGSISYVFGNHQLKVGTDLSWDEQNSPVKKEYPNGSYLLRFNKGVPAEMYTYNSPVEPHNKQLSQAVFVTDTWSMGRVTLSYGLRFDRFHTFYPDQTREKGQFAEAGSFKGADVLTWKSVVPRLGMAWDVMGNGKTSFKASYGMFADHMGASFAESFNPLARIETRYRWKGPCVATQYNNVSYNQPNTSCDWLPGSVDLSPTGKDFIRSSGGPSLLPSPDLKQNKTHQISARFERELVPNLGIGLAYVHVRVSKAYNTGGVNVARPYGVWNVPVVLTDSFTGDPVTLYTYGAEYAGAAFNAYQMQNAPDDRPNTYNSFEATLNKRFSKRWNASVSYWMTKTHEWVATAARPTSPNDDRFPIDDNWTWESRADATYRLPFGISLSTMLRLSNGQLGQRTQTFTNSALRQGSVTLRMEEYGAQKGPVVPITSLRVAKTFKFGERYSLDTNFTVFNLLNNSAATSISYLSGTFGRIQDVLAPRVARFGAKFSF